MIDEINKTAKEHVKKGHIIPSTSPWAFGTVPVKKPDGSIRLCCDFQPLNKITETDSFSTGNMNEVLDQLVGAQYFSCIDLAQRYLQVPLAKEDQPKQLFGHQMVYGNGLVCAMV